jgi:hypothetical protein
MQLRERAFTRRVAPREIHRASLDDLAWTGS